MEDDKQAYDIRQLNLMLSRIDLFMHEKESLQKLIVDIDALLGCLQTKDYSWSKALNAQLMNLESASIDWGPGGYPALPLVNKEKIESATQIINRLVRDKIYSFEQRI